MKTIVSDGITLQAASTTNKLPRWKMVLPPAAFESCCVASSGDGCTANAVGVIVAAGPLCGSQRRCVVRSPWPLLGPIMSRWVSDADSSLPRLHGRQSSQDRSSCLLSWLCVSSWRCGLASDKLLAVGPMFGPKNKATPRGINSQGRVVQMRAEGKNGKGSDAVIMSSHGSW